jgi:Domain of unknown function (DUF4136)
MLGMKTTKHALIATLCVGLAVVLEAAPKIKVRAEPDPNFDFATVRSFAWDQDPGDVKMALTATDDPAALKARVNPLIVKLVADAMTKKGLTDAAGGKSDVVLHYYVLITVSQSGQYMGQFLPSVAYWGLPPFAQQATSVDVATKGSLVLDAMLPGAPGDRKVIWRGMAQSTIADDIKDAEREARLKYAADELVKRFPLKKKK